MAGFQPKGHRNLAVLAGLFILAGAAVGITFLMLALTDSNGPERLLREAHTFRGSMITKHVRLRRTARLAKLPLARLRQLERRREKESEPRLTPVAAEAPDIQSSDFPATSATVSGVGSPSQAQSRITLLRNKAVDAGHASFTAEPYVAQKGQRVLEVWNWGAAFSHDGGRTFSFVSPDDFFSDTEDKEFCCDQLAFYDPQHDLWIWLLQYSDSVPAEHLSLRIVAVKGDANFDATPMKFAVWDIDASQFGSPKAVIPGSDLDNPRIAATNQYLFISANLIRPSVISLASVTSSSYDGSVVFRMPLSDLAAGTQSPTLQYLQTDVGTAGLTRGATDTMYIAAHITNAKLRVWSWPDGKTTISPHDVVHRSYPRRPKMHYLCPRKGARPKEKGDWCLGYRARSYKNDDRPQSGWVSGGVIGFAWNAQQRLASRFKYPFVMIVRINAKDMSLKDTPFIWSPNYAYQYAAIIPNSGGDLGGVVHLGGGSKYETCAAVIRDRNASSKNPWSATEVDNSDHDPDEPRAGDYLGATTDGASPDTWAGSCMTLHGGGTRESVAVRFLSFRRG
jgi:hypothetical protein